MLLKWWQYCHGLETIFVFHQVIRCRRGDRIRFEIDIQKCPSHDHLKKQICLLLRWIIPYSTSRRLLYFLSSQDILFILTYFELDQREACLSVGHHENLEG